MKRVISITTFVLSGLLAVALSLTVTSCEAPMTAEERARLEQLDAGRKSKEAELAQIRERAEAAGKLLVDGDPTNDAAAQADLVAAFEANRQTAQALLQIIEEADKIVAAAHERIGQPLIVAGQTAFPAWAPLLGLLGPAAIELTKLGSKRGREHVKSYVRAAVQLNFPEFLTGLFKSLGHLHSNDDPVAVLSGAEAAAAEKGDLATATRIRALRLSIAEHEARRTLGQAARAVPPAATINATPVG